MTSETTSRVQIEGLENDLQLIKNELELEKRENQTLNLALSTENLQVANLNQKIFQLVFNRSLVWVGSPKFSSGARIMSSFYLEQDAIQHFFIPFKIAS